MTDTTANSNLSLPEDPNTDLDLPEVQRFIDLMAVQVASNNMTSAALTWQITYHIQYGDYPCWVDDFKAYRAALRAEIYKRAEPIQSKRLMREATHRQRQLIASSIDKMIAASETARENLAKLKMLGLDEAAEYQTQIEDMSGALDKMRAQIDYMIRESIS